MNHTINTTTADTLDAWNQEISTSLFPHSILLIVYLVVGSLGNSLVIYVHVFRLQSRKEDRFYIPILAVVDMFSCGFTALFTLALNLLNVKFSNATAYLSDLEYGLYTFLYQFYIFNNVINPVIYGLFDNTFRRDAAQLFRSCCKIVPTGTSMP
ncbi:uncharacterized protein LOC110445802 [Mizuhopecten yessoensis]|uniref:uncharacterized protein LOC110445802 n=1 Tax=Mizuhopecten yessoensis TaxID=6573 RepID=UPI000B45AD52|nr:uncharacterized protein LOC110445802 [Mizuhopecten yessoensis]